MNPSHEREQALFILAAAKPVAERAAFLERECGTDKVLRARLEALLAAHERTEPIIDMPAGQVKATMKLAFADPPDEVIGQKIGRYKILEKVGEGGCGVVYVAEQTEPVRRRVALKVIKLGMDTKQVVARFEAERQALAMMDHPNIAKVLDAGATETGRPYFVMELVRGIRITDYCDQASLPTEARLDLFIQVCHAIQHAHQKGIIHRDIKPSNILVTLNDGVPVPKVIDFGIAKATEGRLTEATVYTQLHQFIGTPAYMSPEQAEMSSLDIDTRSDIYSLGVLLYELLAGATPFDGQELMALGIDAMRKTIREQEPPRPSTRLATLKGDELTTAAKRRAIEAPRLIHLLQGDLDWIVMKCLEKERARRYETANGLVADLKRHLGNEPVLACPPSAIYRFQKAVRRNKLAFAAGTTIVAVLVLGIVVSASQAVRAIHAEKKTAAERDAKELARQEAEGIAKFMTGVFQSPDPARDGRTITVAETLDRATTNLEHELATQPGLRAQLQATLGRTYGTLGLYREAIPLLEKAREYALKTYGLEHANTLATMNGLGICYFYTGRFAEALKLREELLTLARKVLGPEHPETLDAMGNLANSYAEAGRQDEALKLREELLRLRRKAPGPENPDTLKALGTLAISYAEAGRQDEALKLREELLPLVRKLLGPEHPDTLKAMANLANSYFYAGRQDEALKLREKELPLTRKVLGPEHPETLNSMNNLANSYFTAGRFAEALKLREEVLPLTRKVNGPEHRDTFGAMANLALSCDAAGRTEETLKLREELLPLARKLLGPEHPDTLKMQDHLAISYSMAGRNDEALKLFEEELAVRRKVLGPEDHATLGAMNNLAGAYFAVGRKDEALKLRRELLPLRLKVDGPEHPDTIRAMDNLASSYFDAGRADDALKLREEALAARRKVLGPQHPETIVTMNDLAWTLATSDVATIRNGTNAVALAEAVAAATSRQNPDFLDTLAAAYAETQQFDKACAVEREAIALYQFEPQKQEAGSHLSLYLANKPYREPGKH